MILENVILLSFPIFIYLIYLFTNKNIKSKEIYFKLVLLTSIYLVKCFESNIYLSILVLNSVVILLYINNYYIYSNVVGILVLLMFNDYINIYFIIIYIIFGILYFLKRMFNIKNYLFIITSLLTSILIYTIWSYKYMNIKDILTIDMCYIIVTLILYLIYMEGSKILKCHLEYKELKKEEQIRMSLFKITHEIKNPIAVCKGYLDMMNTSERKQVERFIPIIKSEIERLLVILEDFLSLNRNNSKDIMDINMLVENVTEKLVPMVDNKINIKTDLVDDEVYINGDYNRLNQMLLNIIKNSIEAIPNEGNILIKSDIYDKYYIITIEDSGVGMNKDILSKIKEPFFTTKTKGTGLGISLIYEIAEANGIKVQYKSKENYGTKVILKFKRYMI